MGDGTPEGKGGGAGGSPAAPPNAVFAASGVEPHDDSRLQVNTAAAFNGVDGGEGASGSGDGGEAFDPSDEQYAMLRAELEAEADALQAEIRATASQLEGLASGSSEGLSELLTMRGGVEEELLALRHEQWWGLLR
jgi:hypothetical protein